LSSPTKQKRDQLMGDVFELVDELGPEKIIYINNPAARLKAIVVIDNTACGPSIGGIRVAPNVSLEECARLARAMTLKNASAGLPHGGGKSVIFADPTMDEAEKEQLIRAFATAINQIEDYIPGPDMGMNETGMAWIHDEISRAVGLPRIIGGIPLDEIGATGFGVCVAAEVAEDFCDLRLDGAEVAIQGFGAVGKHAARFLVDKGAILVAVSDSRGTVIEPGGLPLSQLLELKAESKSVTDVDGARADHRDAIITAKCDILVPAARPDVINSANASHIKAKLIVQGANIPATLEAEELLHQRGILIIPDFIANAGGVICASVEFHGGSQSQAMNAIEDKIRINTREILERARDGAISPRKAADEFAQSRIRQAIAIRRSF
jgi:glutamate dehydrogenase (NAD(P)+)